MANPLNSFATPLTASLRVPPLPQLTVGNGKVMTPVDVAQFNQAQEQWRQNFERQLNERLAGLKPVTVP